MAMERPERWLWLYPLGRSVLFLACAHFCLPKPLLNARWMDSLGLQHFRASFVCLTVCSSGTARGDRGMAARSASYSPRHSSESLPPQPLVLLPAWQPSGTPQTLVLQPLLLLLDLKRLIEEEFAVALSGVEPFFTNEAETSQLFWQTGLSLCRIAV